MKINHLKYAFGILNFINDNKLLYLFLVEAWVMFIRGGPWPLFKDRMAPSEFSCIYLVFYIDSFFIPQKPDAGPAIQAAGHPGLFPGPPTPRPGR